LLIGLTGKKFPTKARRPLAAQVPFSHICLERRS
jgi:hypothetical protein